MKFSEEQKYVGNLSQLFDVRDCRLVGGRADGVRATTVKTGGGLEFTVLADRCMDIADLSFNGVNCALINPYGIVAPQYPGYIFAGWSTSEGGSVEYYADEIVDVADGITLYAVWEAEVA